MLKIENSKRYMQSAAFWSDSHNQKAAELADKLIFQRDMLGTITKCNPRHFVQRVDGFVEPIKKTGFFHFLKSPGYFEKKFAESMNLEYALIKSDFLKLSQEARKEMIRSSKSLDVEV